MGKWTQLGQNFYDKYAAAEERYELNPIEFDELKTRVAKLENQVSYLFDSIKIAVK